ncbi:MAG: hypothetical protein KC423_07960 [Anaerolineales bacterium]|nr:hypothetical protein [Anaerolineales bacterium]
MGETARRRCRLFTLRQSAPSRPYGMVGFIRWVGATQPGLTLATLYASLPGCVARLLALLAQIRANQRGGQASRSPCAFPR